MLSLFDLAALLITLSALFGWLNYKLFALPHSVGLLTMSVAASLLLVAIDLAFPDRPLFDALNRAMLQIDFSAVVLNGMLGFLLFAGAMHVNLHQLRNRAASIAFLSVFGTVLSTLIVGAGFWSLTHLLNHPVDFAWSLVFGALISPTDPVAVLSTLKTIALPKSTEAEIQGESLFNDGVGIVLFTLLLRAAIGDADGSSNWDIVRLTIVDSAGGLLLGLSAGYLAYRAMRQIDDYPIEVLISLALVMATYAMAQRMHVSGPLAMVAAGLLISDRRPRHAMSDQTQTYLFALWTLIDEVLNSVLFLLIGLEVLVLRFEGVSLLIGLGAIPIVLAARFVAVSVPPFIFPIGSGMLLRNVPLLIWAGIRGGISIALALSMPDNPAKPTILAATYAVVLFSVIIQGSTLQYVARRTLSSKD